AVGAPRYGSQAIALAQEIQHNLGLAPMERPFLAACEELIAPQVAEARLREQMPAWQTHWTSDDYVEMSWYAPTVRLYVARPMLAVPPGYAGYPAWVSNALGGLGPCIDPTIAVAANTAAAPLPARLTPPHIVGAAPFLAPLLPRTFAPPLDSRWPEYITTARGADWWIPAAPELEAPVHRG